MELTIGGEQQGKNSKHVECQKYKLTKGPSGNRHHDGTWVSNRRAESLAGWIGEMDPTAGEGSEHAMPPLFQKTGQVVGGALELVAQPVSKPSPVMRSSYLT
jgi:hypothetical protein